MMYGAPQQGQGAVMAVPYMSSGVTLPETTNPYMIYYVPMNRDGDKAGANSVIESIGREAGINIDLGRGQRDNNDLDQRREYLKALNHSTRSLHGMEVNPLENIEMTQKFIAGPQPGYGGATFKPGFAKSHAHSVSAFEKYANKTPSLSAYSEASSSRKSPEVRATIIVDSGAQIELSVDPNIVIAEIIRKVIDQLVSVSETQRTKYLNDYALFYGEKELDFIKRLKEYGISGRDISLNLKPKTSTASRRQEESSRGARMASMSTVPKLSKQGYETEPSYMNICRMSESELANVEDFAIKNHWGRIEFLGRTDLRGLNLDKIVVIEKGKVEIYPENQDRPTIGQGLNKSAAITFYHYGIRNKANLNEWIGKFREKATKMGAEYIGHDIEEDSITIQVEGSNN